MMMMIKSPASRAWLFALATLVALAAAALLTLSQTGAQSPGVVTLELGLQADGDTNTSPGTTVMIDAELVYSSVGGGGDRGFTVESGTLRLVAGDQQWEDDGRRTTSLTAMGGQEWTKALAFVTTGSGAGIGSDVAIQERPAAEGGDIVVITAMDVDNFQGRAYLFVGGKFIAELRGEHDPDGSSWFGKSAAVGGGIIAVGAHQHFTNSGRSCEEPRQLHCYISNAGRDRPRVGQGAVWLFNERGERLGRLDSDRYGEDGDGDGHWRAVGRFGYGVAISEDGGTIAVSGSPAGINATTPEALVRNQAAGWVFTRPAGGWTSMTIDHPNVTYLDQDGTCSSTACDGQKEHLMGAGIAISDDGSTIALGHEFHDISGGATDLGLVQIYERPSGGWNSVDKVDARASLDVATDQTTFAYDGGTTAELRTINFLRMGHDVAIDADGDTVVAGVGGRHTAAGWPGAALVYVKQPSGWGSQSQATAILTDTDAHVDDMFGRGAAINDAGDTILVAGGNWNQTGGEYDQGTAHIYKRPGGGWVDDSAADQILYSPNEGGQATSNPMQLNFGDSGVAIDGEGAAVVGQTELYGHRPWFEFGVAIDTGRAWTFDLTQAAAVDVQGSAVELGGFGSCDEDVLEGLTTWRCRLTFGNTRIAIPALPEKDSFTISGSISGAGETVTGRQTFTVEGIKEVASLEFDFAEDDKGTRDQEDDEPYPDRIAAGESTQFLLKVLNENGTASATDTISSITVISTGEGTLSIEAPSAGGRCSGRTCSFIVRRLTGSNSDKIRIALAHPGEDKSGTSEVSVNVTSKVGESFRSETKTVTFSGPAVTLMLSEAPTAVLSYSPADPPGGQDHRDRLRFSVTAEDESGFKAGVPTTQRRAVVKDPKGRAIWRAAVPGPRNGIDVKWPLTDEDGDPVLDADGNLQVQIDVSGTHEQQLAYGEYTLEIEAGGKMAAQPFVVTGGAAEVRLSAPEGPLTPGSPVTLTAQVLDTGGDPVPDGTEVTWSEGSTTAQALLVQTSAETATKNGQASVTYLMLAEGAAWVTASANPAGSDVQLLRIREELPVEETMPEDSLSSRVPDRLSTYFGQTPTQASVLVPRLAGVQILLLWQNGAWQRYGLLPDGTPLPGSMDFEVGANAILWLGGD